MPKSPCTIMRGHNSLRDLVALTVLHLIEEFEILNSIPSLAHIFMETDHEIFSTVIFPLLLIQGGQLSIK